MKKLDPKASWLGFYTLFPFGVVFIAILFIIPSIFISAIYLENQPVLRDVVRYGTFPFMLLVWGIVSYFLSKRSYNKSGFILTEEGIKFKKGILMAREYFIPYSEIETVNYQKGAEITYARITSLSGIRRSAGAAMGLYSLYINTDRSLLEEMDPTSKLYTKESKELQGLSKEQVTRIYRKILERSNAQGLRKKRKRKLNKFKNFIAEHPIKFLFYFFLFLIIGIHFIVLISFWKYPDLLRDFWGLNGLQAWKRAEMMNLFISFGVTILMGIESIYLKFKRGFEATNVSPWTLLLIFLSSLLMPFVIVIFII